ncbi:hypothetical protein ALC56_12415 [Trachymyrmex septentrionalis]|uniref:Uncharacterized protein n=1 Tax=Trachymyrmex septentrionalis TaxID=34720 RepID=A0A195EYR1_9HYME|nr:hypothetical protein ALC56_12415 [Trachymyrmex septentrionalis]
MTTRNLHFNPSYYGCSNVILAHIRRRAQTRTSEMDLLYARCKLSRYSATLLSPRDISLRYVTYTMIYHSVVVVYIHTYICVEIAKVPRSVREISRIRCLLCSGENQRYVRMDILCKYEKQSTKAGSKTNLHLTRDTRAITDNLAVRVAPIYHTVVVANLLVRSKSYPKAPLYKNRFSIFLEFRNSNSPITRNKDRNRMNNTFCLNR